MTKDSCAPKPTEKPTRGSLDVASREVKDHVAALKQRTLKAEHEVLDLCDKKEAELRSGSCL